MYELNNPPNCPSKGTLFPKENKFKEYFSRTWSKRQMCSNSELRNLCSLP